MVCPTESPELLLRRHGAALAREAQRILAHVPEARLAGVIAAAAAPDAERLRAVLRRCSSQELPAGLVVGLVPWPLVADLVGHPPPPDRSRGMTDDQPLLPVIVSTRGATRVAFLPYAAGAAAGA